MQHNTRVFTYHLLHLLLPETNAARRAWLARPRTSDPQTLLEQVLQLYAAHTLAGPPGAAEGTSAEAALERLLAAGEEEWDTLLRTPELQQASWLCPPGPCGLCATGPSADSSLTCAALIPLYPWCLPCPMPRLPHVACVWWGGWCQWLPPTVDSIHSGGGHAGSLGPCSTVPSVGLERSMLWKCIGYSSPRLHRWANWSHCWGGCDA